MSEDGELIAEDALPEFSPDPQSSSSDANAETEAVKIGAGDNLEEDGKKREHGRNQKFRDNVNQAVLIIFWFIVTAICLGIFVFAWHLLTPPSVHFLDDKAIDKLQGLLGTAVLSSALTGYAKGRMS